LFQDSAGTTPVTAVEQPVGLQLDLSQGLVLGSEVIAYPINGNLGPSYTIVGNTIVRNGSSGTAVLNPSTTVPATTKTYLLTFTVTNQSGDAVYVRVGGGTAYGPFSGNGTFTLRAPGGGVQGAVTFLPSGGGAATATYSNISLKELPGNHAFQATSANRPVLKIDGNGKYYLQFDGSNDSMATNSINFTSTDKMSVFAGSRLTVSGPGTLVSLGNRNANSFESTYIGTTSPFALLGMVGNTGQASRYQNSSSLDTTLVRTDSYDLAASGTTGLVLRINGAQVATVQNDPGPTGGGTFGNRALSVGVRGPNSPSDSFNGRMYSLIVVGKAVTADELSSTETYVNQKTRAY
jgi:hypothetical protein